MYKCGRRRQTAVSLLTSHQTLFKGCGTGLFMTQTSSSLKKLLNINKNKKQNVNGTKWNLLNNVFSSDMGPRKGLRPRARKTGKEEEVYAWSVSSRQG